MAKNTAVNGSDAIVVRLSDVFTSGRGETMSVREALAWYTENYADEDGNVPYSAGDLVVYAVRRLMALHKDHARYVKGKLAARLYAPRVDNVAGKVPTPLVKAVAAVAACRPDPTPAEKPAKAAKAAKPSPAPAAKPPKAAPAPAAKPPKAAPAPAPAPAPKALKVAPVGVVVRRGGAR